MIQTFEDLCIYVYATVDALFQAYVQPHDRRPGPHSQFSDSEVITLTLVAELVSLDDETVFLDYVARNQIVLQSDPVGEVSAMLPTLARVTLATFQYDRSDDTRTTSPTGSHPFCKIEQPALHEQLCNAQSGKVALPFYRKTEALSSLVNIHDKDLVGVYWWCGR